MRTRRDTHSAIDFNPNAGLWFDVLTVGTTPTVAALWEPGEEGEIIDRTWGNALESLDPSSRSRSMREATAWFEHAVAGGHRHSHRRGLARRTSVLCEPESEPAVRGIHQAVDVTDPGPDGRVGTETMARMSGSTSSPGIVDLPFVNVVRNVSGLGQHYWTWEVAANKRFDGRWYYAGLHMWSFDHTWNDGSSEFLSR